MELTGRTTRIVGVAQQRLGDLAACEAWVREAAAICGATRLGLLSYNMQADAARTPGCTVLALIAESHISLHTFPEIKQLSVHVYSCMPYNPWSIRESVCRYFNITDLRIYEEKPDLGLHDAVEESTATSFETG